MKAFIQKWGNSQGIRIPKILLDAINWNDNESVTLSIDDDKIIIEKAAESKQSIIELFDNFEGEYTPDNIDWGQPEGNEIW